MAKPDMIVKTPEVKKLQQSNTYLLHLVTGVVTSLAEIEGKLNQEDVEGARRVMFQLMQAINGKLDTIPYIITKEDKPNDLS